MDDILQSAPAMLAASLARWQSLGVALAPAWLTRPPAPGEWSAMECLQHMLDFDELLIPVRVAACRAEGTMPNFEPELHGRKLAADVTPAALLAEFTRWRTNTLRLIAGVRPEELGRTARHAELGPATLGEFLHECVGHDLMHLTQAELALQRPFAEGAGPWRQYF